MLSETFPLGDTIEYYLRTERLFSSSTIPPSLAPPYNPLFVITSKNETRAGAADEKKSKRHITLNAGGLIYIWLHTPHPPPSSSSPLAAVIFHLSSISEKCNSIPQMYDEFP